MTDKTNKILEQLLTGQQKLEIDVTGLKEGQRKLETDVAGLKTDVTELKEGQKKLETDVTGLKTDVNELKIDVAGLKTDVNELKIDVAGLKTDVTELKEGQKRTELFLLNMENRIMPIINATYEISKLNKEQIDSIRETQSKHSDKLENHELRILKLESAEQ